MPLANSVEEFRKHFDLNVVPEYSLSYTRFADLSEEISKGIPVPAFLVHLEEELKKVENYSARLQKECAEAQKGLTPLKINSLKKGPQRKTGNKTDTVIEMGQQLAKMIIIYDYLNKAKSYAVLNQQAIECLLSVLRESPAAADLDSKNMIDQMHQRLRVSPLFDIKAIETAQHQLEKMGLGTGVLSSGVRRPSRLEHDIIQATANYDQWLAQFMPCKVVEADLAMKGQHMAENSFMFLRATFYRWAQLWPVICPGLSAAPHVLAVGDLHVENYGTWRDSEGRWIWGINDFDEAFPMAYTADLVRLAVSILFCADQKRCRSPEPLIVAVLQGYTDALAKGGAPIILDHHPLLLSLALRTAKDADKYWKRLANYPELVNAAAPPDAVLKHLQSSLPQGAQQLRVFHRTAGLGSLGRPRFVILAQYQGGLVARESKPSVPSACYFAAKHGGPFESRQLEIIQRAVRAQDPFVRDENGWSVRRLSSQNSRLEFENSTPQEEAELFYRMGWELGNIHLGSTHASDNVRRDLASRPKKWLYQAALHMKEASDKDYSLWRQHYHQQHRTSSHNPNVASVAAAAAAKSAATTAAAQKPKL